MAQREKILDLHNVTYEFSLSVEKKIFFGLILSVVKEEKNPYEFIKCLE